ncbi:SOS response-associated peptidase family protein [Variovorax paradoxus]|uniref:SOS response-associated peptidase family protein n=1 Tax=Variovorax paradoxus TaxID=34073 RepID=UPI00193129C1|nr:SOS response-associated peptidase family protein [Variovorax paradoxus]
MCFSASTRAEHSAFRRLFPKSLLSIKDFYREYISRKKKSRPFVPKFPKAMDANFSNPTTNDERAIKALIDEYDAEQAMGYERTLFEQRARLVKAERKLQEKETKTALHDQRVASEKIAAALAKLEDLKRTELKPRDGRIFPGWYAPVLVIEDGEWLIKPMRYQCRPAGKPAFYDTKYPGTYNARRNSLEGFWKGQFGQSHGLMIVNGFYENVKRHDMEHRELRPGEEPENVVLEFRPRPTQDMLIACLYSHWTPPEGSDEPELWSFAAITDEPPLEVADAGHDRCIVQLRHENVEAWLSPEGRSKADLEKILEDKERPYYEHQMAA